MIALLALGMAAAALALGVMLLFAVAGLEVQKRDPDSEYNLGYRAGLRDGVLTSGAWPRRRKR